MRTVVLLGLASALGGCAVPPPPAPSLATSPAVAPVVLSASGPAARSGAPEGDPAVARLLALTDRANPVLAAERKGIDVATAAVWQAELAPNPTLEAEVEDYRLGVGSWHGSTRRVGVSVPLVVSGRLRAARTAAEAERDVKRLQYVSKREEVFLEVRRAYVDLAAARRLHEVAVAARDLAAGLVETVRARHQAGVAPESEVWRTEIERSRAESDVETTARDVEAARRVLDAAVGAPVPGAVADASVLAAGYEVPSWEALRALTAKHREVGVARSEAVAARTRIELAQAETFRDPDLHVSAGENEAGDSVVGLGVGVPLPLNDRGQARLASARAAYEAAVLRVEGVRRDVERRGAGLYRDFVTAEERARRYENEILPAAEKALEQTRAGYEVGKLPYLEVLDARRTLAEARVAHVQALADMNRAAQEIESFLCVYLVPTTREEMSS